MKYLINYQQFESTMHYLPSLSDDGTADSLSDIRKKTSKIQNIK